MVLPQSPKHMVQDFQNDGTSSLTIEKLRIAYLLQHVNIDLTAQKAIQVHSQQVVSALQKVGHSVYLVSLQNKQIWLCDDLDALKDKIPCQKGSFRFAHTKFFQFLESFSHLKRQLLKSPYLAILSSLRLFDGVSTSLKDFQILHERYEPFHLGGVWAAKRLKIPLVLEVNGDMLKEWEFQGHPATGLRKIYATWATSTMFQHAAKIIVVSEQLQNHLHATWGVPRDKMVVLPNAADVEMFRPRLPNMVLRQKIGLPDTSSIITFVGGFYKWHAPDLMLRAFSKVVEQEPQAHLLLVGDGPLYNLVVQLIAELNLDKNVTLLGKVKHDLVPQLLSFTDIAIAPFTEFPQGLGGSALKLFEYMAAGKPIVVTATGQVIDVVKHEETGLLARVGDSKQFANEVLRLLKDETLRNILGKNAREYVVQNHTWQQQALELTAVYSNLL